MSETINKNEYFVVNFSKIILFFSHYVIKGEKTMRFLTVQEAAKVISVDRKTIYHMIQTENLRAYKISERGLRIKEEDLLEWMEKRKL